MLSQVLSRIVELCQVVSSFVKFCHVVSSCFKLPQFLVICVNLCQGAKQKEGVKGFQLESEETYRSQ